MDDSGAEAKRLDLPRIHHLAAVLQEWLAATEAFLTDGQNSESRERESRGPPRVKNGERMGMGMGERMGRE